MNEKQENKAPLYKIEYVLLAKSRMYMKQHTTIALFLLLFIATSCINRPKDIRISGRCIPVTATEAVKVADETRNIIARGRATVDSIKAPIIGCAAKRLELYTPESPLMNFAADALLATARQHCKEQIDIAITNKGGLRRNIEAGEITFGDIYNVFPFDNRLTTLTLDGKQLLSLLQEIAAANGEPISGARLTVAENKEGKGYRLLSATVGGKHIEPHKRYRIATSDYLSQGNDKLTTLAEGSDKRVYTTTIRDLMIEYIESLNRRNIALDANEDGRIKVEK